MNGTQLRTWLAAWWILAGMATATAADEFRNVIGQHIELTSDIESEAEANELVASFDRAVEQWREFWELPERSLDAWSVKAFVMQDKASFQDAGLIDPRVPDFKEGYALGNSVWIMA